MSAHPSAETRTRYFRGLLPAEEFLEVDDHLAACAECRDALSPSLAHAAASMRDGIAGEHLSYEEMEAYVDDERHSAHLEICAMCAAEVADLQAERKVRHGLFGGLKPALSAVEGPAAVLFAAAAAAAILFALSMFFREPKTVPAVQPRAVTKQPVPIARPPALRPELAGVLQRLAVGVLPSAALVEELEPGVEPTRGDETEEPLKVTSPRGVIEDVRPLFRWSTRSGATYVVEIFDSADEPVARSSELRRDGWRPAVPLRRGATYSWQVIETRAGEERIAPSPPDPPARFAIIGEKAAAELDAARAAASHLAAGLIYAREGVIERAIEELSLAQKENPRSDDIGRAIATLRRYQ